jgi:hypothetical protein
MPDNLSYLDMAKVSGDMLSMIDRLRREVEALEQMLLEKGMTRTQVRREVKQRVKYLGSYEEASVLFRRVCQEILERIHAEDPLVQLAKKLPKKERKEMD